MPITEYRGVLLLRYLRTGKPLIDSHQPSSDQPQRFMMRKPHRISITLPHSTYEMLISRSTQEGRSLSNLASCLIEKMLRMR